MRKINILVIMSLALLFTACAPKIYQAEPIDVSKYSALYETSYDIEDNFIGHTIKKGTKFIPRELGDKMYKDGLQEDKLPTNTIGLEYGRLYILVYPDGSFISEDIQVLELNGNNQLVTFAPARMVANFGMNLFTTRPGQPPFTLVENK